LHELLSHSAGSDAFGGWLAAVSAVASAEATRANGTSDPDAWRTAASAGPDAGAWLMAYTQYRLGEALLTAHGSRREAQAALSEAFAVATHLSAAPLIAWIEAVARRSRVSIQAPKSAVEPSDERPSAAEDLGLTSREREVLSLVAEGYTNRRIAETLFISESTAGVHVSNILGKLGVASRTEAATIAARLGIGT
jgi:DNA-binding NarL/FixJ family response regulator